ncbi:hypothetical protein I6G77_27750 (plasmid) [Bacillus tropicus]|uniref:Uncharacterized protein n=1 Tax=Bacillus tropicus TaxID=2026188 RepID=A0A7T2QKT8_9BACI|nr:DUF6414 family protein [Bacillus tropicus]AJG91248.1 hypothetical protein BG03_5635 [Bacillus cereus]QPR80618.1 hypothetical protein I6G77_27750 [Bacillus tropicus]
MIIKVVYFDESSAADFLQMYYGGSLVVTDEGTGKYSIGFKGKASGEIGASTSFLSLLKAKISMSASGEMANSKDSLLKTTITNTILTDFVNLSGEDSEKNIEIFNGFKVMVPNESITFAKMYTPFIKMLKEGSKFTEGLADYNYLELDEILQHAKGYYELLATNGERKVIFRFNINTLRNGYNLTDLPKMNLTYYGIEVGACREEDLLFENEFSINKSESRETVSIEEIYNGLKNEEPNLLKIYDIVLAGIAGVKE